MTSKRTAVMWFRRDLRLVDNPALMAAAVLCDGVAPLYVLDERLIDGPSASDNRTWFLLESLRVLDERLRRMGNRLHIRAGRPEDAVPRFAAETNASLVTVSRDYSPFGMRRDGRVKATLEAAGIEWRACAGVLAVEPEAMTLASGRAYEVFRPFYRRWSAVEGREVLDAPTPLPAAGTFERPVIQMAEPLACSAMCPAITIGRPSSSRRGCPRSSVGETMM